jgi:hypothetical protein
MEAIMRNSLVATPVVGRQVRQHRGYDKTSTVVKYIAAALLIGVSLGGGSAFAGLDATTDVADVEYLTGRVVVFSQGRPTLLDVLDVINDRTQLDLLANSEFITASDAEGRGRVLRDAECMVRPCVARGFRRSGDVRSCINVSGF